MSSTLNFGPKGWTPERLESLAGKTYVITGTTTGVGLEATKILLNKDATVIMMNRDADTSAKLIQSLKQEHGQNANVSFIRLDLAELASVRTAAAAALAQTAKIDALICNAAISQIASQELTVDGFESQIGVNYYGHFLLCGLLFDRIETSNGRIVIVGSQGYKMGLRKIKLDDMNWDKNYNPNNVYCHSKLAQMMMAYELQKRIKVSNRNVKVYVCHPGASRTSLIDEKSSFFYKIVFSLLLLTPLAQSAEKGAFSEVMCATEDNLDESGYYGPTGTGNFVGPVGSCDYEPFLKDEETAKKLWSHSEEKTSVSWPQ